MRRKNSCSEQKNNREEQKNNREEQKNNREERKNNRAGRLKPARLFFFCQVPSAKARQRKVTISARVQVLLGLKVVSVVPVVIPRSTAQRTAFRK